MTKDYYGTKRVTAWREDREEGNNIQPGYAVKYPDGYVSWSPKDVFEEAYQPLDALSFGHAIEAAKAGHKIARRGWNGKGMFVALMGALYLPPYNSQEPGAKVNDHTAKFIGKDTPLDSQPYFAMYTANQLWQPGWLASQADMLANDWMIADDRPTPQFDASETTQTSGPITDLSY